MIDKRQLKNIDPLLIVVFFLLLGISLVVLSTASANLVPGQPYYYVKRQALWIVTGLFWVVALAYIDYQKWRRLTWVIYVFNLLLLLAVFFVGEETKGATRWIPITSSFSIQPSEFAKILVILTLADFLAKRKGKLNRFVDFIPPFLFVLPPILLVFKQPDLGTTLVFAAIFIAMMFVAGANPWKFGGLILGGLAIMIGMIYVHLAADLPPWLQWAKNIPMPLEDYQLQRITVFLDPLSDTSGDGYQIIQSIWAIGSGGLWGKGYQSGTQVQLNFLPEHHTDFIFSVIGEEFGFIGTSTTLFLFCIFLVRGILVAAKARDFYGMLIATGIVAMFLFHIFVNVGMTSGIMPVTGIPLPLISSGGSSMWTNMMAIGLLLSISLHRQRLMF